MRCGKDAGIEKPRPKLGPFCEEGGLLDHGLVPPLPCPSAGLCLSPRRNHLGAGLSSSRGRSRELSAGIWREGCLRWCVKGTDVGSSPAQATPGCFLSRRMQFCVIPWKILTFLFFLFDFFILSPPASLRYKSPKTWRGAEGEGWPGCPNSALKGAP